MHMAAAKGRNGLIIPLNQEKAYDKISHNYLWKVLEGFNLPTSIIGPIKLLYQEVRSSIMVNRFISSKYQVTRGIRQ
jgi:hypothetical protein